MAKLIVLNTGFRLWALTRAEDYLLIDAYLSIKRYVPSSDLGFLEFERRYFSDGGLLSDKFLMMLNCILKRKGYDVLHLREGHSDSYTLLKGQPKAQERASIREALEEMTVNERALVVDNKAAEVNRQVERDAVYDATKAARLTPLKPHGTAKVAHTALTEQLVSAMDSGRLAPSAPSKPRTDGPQFTTEMAKPRRTDVKTGRVLLTLRECGEVQPAVDAPPQGEKRGQTAVVKLAMLSAMQDEVSAIREEMAALQTMRVENGALHAAVAEIERLKQVIAANQDEVRGLRAALKAFQSSIAEVALAA